MTWGCNRLTQLFTSMCVRCTGLLADSGVERNSDGQLFSLTQVSTPSQGTHIICSHVHTSGQFSSLIGCKMHDFGLSSCTVTTHRRLIGGQKCSK